MNDDTEFVKSLKHLKIVREDKTQFPYLANANGRYYILPHGVKYKVAVQNPFTSIKCSCKITIDGEQMGDWILSADNSFICERPVDLAERFTFLRVNLVQQAEALNKKSSLTALEQKDSKDILRLTPLGSGITSGKPENGLVEVTFVPEDVGLFVRTPTGKIISLYYDPKKEICDIIQMIYDNDKTLRSVPLLSFCGFQLPNHQTLEESGILKGNTIEMTFCSGKPMQLFVRTLNGKIITLECFPNELVYGLMRKIYDRERVDVDQQRLTFAGKQLYNELSLVEYGIINDSTIHLALRIVGGRGVTRDETPVILEEIKEKPPRLAAGATTLHGESSQEWGESVTFHEDESKAVSFSVRLVANADEDLSYSTVVMDTSIKPTPLKDLSKHRAPSPVQER
jgi:large subunit ribosomal protein L40e